MNAVNEPQWLNEEERLTWMRLVSLSVLLPATVEANLKASAGLSFFEYHVLAMLSDGEHRTRLMSDLAAWSNSSLSRLSHVITRLEKQGWVRREPSAEDRRATNAVLTDEGFAHLKEHAPAHVEDVRSLVFDQLDAEDVVALGVILDKILESINPEHGHLIA